MKIIHIFGKQIQNRYRNRRVATPPSTDIHWRPVQIYYRPQRSWGKVIFSQASVILLTGGVSAGGVCSRGVPGAWRPPRPGDPPGTATATGGTHPTGMHSCLLEDPPPHTHTGADIWWLALEEARTVGESAWYASYWNAF